ncbi:putative membrane protein [Neisseria meningitidis 2008223]|nr:putative membrane protein [Neisseria meningitidis 2008223]
MNDHILQIIRKFGLGRIFFYSYSKSSIIIFSSYVVYYIIYNYQFNYFSLLIYLLPMLCSIYMIIFFLRKTREILTIYQRKKFLNSIFSSRVEIIIGSKKRKLGISSFYLLNLLWLIWCLMIYREQVRLNNLTLFLSFIFSLFFLLYNFVLFLNVYVNFFKLREAQYGK